MEAYCRKCGHTFVYEKKNVELSITASGCRVPFVKCPLCGYNVAAKEFNNEKENKTMTTNIDIKASHLLFGAFIIGFGFHLGNSYGKMTTSAIQKIVDSKKEAKND